MAVLILPNAPVKGIIDAHSMCYKGTDIGRWLYNKKLKRCSIKYLACAPNGSIVDTWKKSLYKGEYCILMRAIDTDDVNAWGYFLTNKIITYEVQSFEDIDREPLATQS